MVFTLKKKRDNKLERLYEQIMDEMEGFFGFRWDVNRPKVWLVPDRETIDSLRGQKTPRWLVGWGGAQVGGVYILDREDFEKESDNRYSQEKWEALVKHELVHCFYDVVSGQRRPIWLSEGVSTYLSGQNQWKEPIKKFEKLLDCYASHDRPAYYEGGFVVELLIERYGKEKLLELLKAIKREKPDESGFARLFEKVYGIELSYEKLNDLLDGKGDSG